MRKVSERLISVRHAPKASTTGVIFKHFPIRMALVEKLTKSSRPYNRGEYVSTNFDDYLKSEGIICHEHTVLTPKCH